MAEEMHTDIVIIGGGLGGCQAAISAAKAGKQVILTEETAWIGGQLTSQAVPPDEHPFIETEGATASYRAFRNRVRTLYREDLKATKRDIQELNPGGAIVSRIAHEPKVARFVLEEMMMPYVSKGRIVVLLNTQAIKVETVGDEIASVTVQSNDRISVLTGTYFIDATECGDLLPLAGVEYVVGAEASSDTGEPNAADAYRPLDVQPITWCLALDYEAGADHTIEKPAQYGFWRDYQSPHLPFKQLSWNGPDAETGNPKTFSLFGEDDSFPLWAYRRVWDRELFNQSGYDISIMNWPQNDYCLGSIIDVSEAERQKHLEGARQLSLSYLYWMQTEAERPDGGSGYPGLRLRPDVVGTETGLAMYPYIRESRRIRAEYTVVEQDVAAAYRNETKDFNDSIGIGAYRIDLHPTTETHTLFYTPSLPFEIPLGSLLPIRINNLLPAAKNIGTTQITNGCYRVHPVEWNIGEVVGNLAAYAIDQDISPRDVRNHPQQLEAFQRRLQSEGVNVKWPKHLRRRSI